MQKYVNLDKIQRNNLVFSDKNQGNNLVFLDKIQRNNLFLIHCVLFKSYRFKYNLFVNKIGNYRMLRC